MKRAVSKRKDEFGIASVIKRDYSELSNENCEERVERFTSLAIKWLQFEKSPPQKKIRDSTILIKKNEPYPKEIHWLCEFALRLASDPVHLSDWASQNLNKGIKKLIEMPTLARAARFLVIAIHRTMKKEVFSGPIYAGWKWK